MTIRSGFFNSKNGDRKYNARDISKYFDKLITSGVFPNPSDQLQVVASKGMTLNVLPGRGFVDCQWIDNDANYAITIEKSDIVLNRIDAVVMKCDLNESVRDVHIEVKKGVPATNPVAPSMTRNEYVKEYCLATVYVAKLADTIVQSNITDTRANTNVCGWVTGLIKQVDTSTLFAQWQDAYERFYDESNKVFDEWFKHLKETVSTATLIRTFTKVYKTTTADEKTIPIGITQYNQELDILNVFINGLKLVVGLDFSISEDGKSIVLTLPVDQGTPVAFEVLKSVDGSNAETLVGMVDELQEKTETLKTKQETHGNDIIWLGNQVSMLKKGYVVSASKWAKNDVTGFYEYTISNQKITAETMVQVNFNVSSIEAAQNAEVLGITESYAGGVKIFARAIPADDLVCDYIIMRGSAV